MGESISKECNTLSKKIWNFRIKDNVWISTELISGCKHITAVLRKNFSYSKFFWFVFSGIRTEYGEHCENCIRFYLQERNHAVVQGNQTLIITLGKQHRYED